MMPLLFDVNLGHAPVGEVDAMKARLICVLFAMAILWGCATQSTHLATSPPVSRVEQPLVKPQVFVYLPETGRTVALGFGQILVVTLPVEHYNDNTWYVYRNSPPGLQLVAGPNEEILKNPPRFYLGLQLFYFKRVAPGTINLTLEQKYFSKPMLLTVVDGPAYVPPPPPPPPPPKKRAIRKLVLRGIHFDFDKSDIRPGDAAVLDEDISALKASPNASIEVNGYCDAIGTEKYNLKLSERRASAVVNYLVQAGISRDRLSQHGFGKTNFVATNATTEGRAQNRRVELVPYE
jgi:outer membrane protein OmpA-like peptidoglycan-associated protein